MATKHETCSYMSMNTNHFTIFEYYLENILSLLKGLLMNEKNFTKRHTTTHHKQRTQHRVKQLHRKYKNCSLFVILSKSKTLKERDLDSNVRFNAS